MKKIFSVLFVCILLVSICASAFAVTVDLETGTNVAKVLYTVSAGETIISLTHAGGQIPNGLTVSASDDRTSLSLSGVPTTPGVYSFTVTVGLLNASGETVYHDILVNGNITSSSLVITGGTPVPEITPTPAATIAPITSQAFEITKHPGAENRVAGTYAIFIAKATGATAADWTITGNGNAYSVDQFKTAFPGVIVSVDNKLEEDGNYSSTITFEKITSAMNNFSAYATFSNGERILKTNSAAMIITEATPTPAPSPSATVRPTATPVATATIMPTATPLPTSTPLPTVAPTVTPNQDDVISHKSSNTGAIIATVLVGLLTIGVAIILIMYVRGKVDLSWLENKLDNKGKNNRDDGDDV